MKIHSFEPSQSDALKQSILDTIQRINFNRIDNNVDGGKIEFYNKALWVEDGNITFYDSGNEESSIIYEKSAHSSKATTVESIDLGKWIMEKFSKDDHIILKLDTEGAEYEIIERMVNDGSIEYVDKFYCEIHGLKCGRSIEDTIKLLDLAASRGHKLYTWCANTLAESHLGTDSYYTVDVIEGEYQRWHKRFAAVTKSHVDAAVSMMKHKGITRGLVSGIMIEIKDDGRVLVSRYNGPHRLRRGSFIELSDAEDEYRSV